MQDLHVDLYGKMTEPWHNFHGTESEKRDHSHPRIRNTEEFRPKKRPFLVKDTAVSSGFEIRNGEVS